MAYFLTKTNAAMVYIPKWGMCIFFTQKEHIEIRDVI